MGKKIFSILFLIAAFLLAVRSFMLKPYQEEVNLELFGALPVQADGRIKPIDTVARNNLALLSGKESLKIDDVNRIPATRWLITLAANPTYADTQKIFRIDHPELLGLFGWQQDEKMFSLDELRPHLPTLEEQARKVNPEAGLRTTFEKAVLKLYSGIVRYSSLKQSFHDPFVDGSTVASYQDYAKSIPAGLEAVRQQTMNESFDQAAFDKFIQYSERYIRFSKQTEIGVIPPEEGDHWNNFAEEMLNSPKMGGIHPVVMQYGALMDHYKNEDVAAFNETALQLQDYYNEALAATTAQKVKTEFFFSRWDPFMQSMVLYVLLFLFVCFWWLFFPKDYTASISIVLLIAFAFHTIGLILRMYISGRPPVTNLYSSAVFVGWAAVLLGWILERYFKNGIGAMTSAVVGFLTLLVAGFLGLGGDTMEMLQAVLDTNFWLATHVVVISMGYSAAFLAGFLAILYIFLGVFTKKLDREVSRNLSRMVYAIICFALLFSFVGTMLGGIWADQSWGRFWGWDPKENGALLIVLWTALILHARWGGLVKDRGVMLLSIGANIITSWSWFGTNMLGIGLHSYGFMDKAFVALMAFVGINIAIIALGNLPLRYWRSDLLK